MFHRACRPDDPRVPHRPLSDEEHLATAAEAVAAILVVIELHRKSEA